MSALLRTLKTVFASSYGADRPDFFFWYPKDTPASEKKLLFKIDFFILTYGCLSYLAKWLDQSNLSNAYVSGMREDLRMFGTEFNTAQTCFLVGQIIGPIPSNILLTYIPPRFYLPGMEFLWGVLTIGSFAVKTVPQLYALRFLTGLATGSSFVGIQYVLGSWYKRTEIGKRTAIFACAAYVGTMFSGYIQSGVLKGLNGRHGLEAWRWVFIVDGIITIVIALYGAIFFPDTPHKTKAFYFSAEEKARCVERLREDGREETTNFSWSLFPRTLKSWKIYVLVPLFMLWSSSPGIVGNTIFQLFLKNDPARKWSLYDVNNIPTSINGMNIVMLLLLNTYADATGCRMRAVAVNLCVQIFGTICLIVWDVPFGLHVLAYMTAACDGPLSPLYFSWANILTAGDTQVRAVTLATMNAFGSATAAVMQQFAYPVTAAPTFGKGLRVSLALLCFAFCWASMVRLLEAREVQRRDREVEEMMGADPAGDEKGRVDVKAEQKV